MAIPKSTSYEAFCMVCCGGGKTLKVASKRDCAREATSHGNLYGHAVTILYKPQASSSRIPAGA